MHLIRRGLVLIVILTVLGAPGAIAQSGDNLPPVAAPTSRIDVDAIPVVRSTVEQARDFLNGLLRGLRADERLQGIAVAIVQDQHPLAQVSSGSAIASTLFPANGLERVFDVVAIQQLIQTGHLKPGQDIGSLLDGRPSFQSLAAAMTGQGNNAELARIITQASGIAAADYLEQQIFQPLGMDATRIQNGALRTNPSDMIRFAAALVNVGEPGTPPILDTSSVASLEDSSWDVGGWGFGLPELRRNGWRALQIDGSADGYSSRFVIVPEAKLAYVLLARGRTDARFWSALDNSVFDDLLPPKTSTPIPARAGSLADEEAVTGTYEPDRSLREFVFLKFPERELRVTAGDDGSLVLSGAENAILLPHIGGGWATRDGNLSVRRQEDELFFSSGAAYRPVPFYKRPALYALVALAMALGTVGFVLSGRAAFLLAWLNGRGRNLSIG